MTRIKLAWIVLRHGYEALHDFVEFMDIHENEVNELVESLEVSVTEHLDELFTTRAHLEQN
jgi:hypothetical protein